MKDWVNCTIKAAYESDREYIFPRKVLSVDKNSSGVVLHMEGSKFKTKHQKSFGYEFDRFSDTGKKVLSNIYIDAVGNHSFRIRFNNNGPITNETLMVNEIPSGVIKDVFDGDGIVSITLEKATLEIRKKPFHVTLLSGNGTILAEIPGIDTAHPNASGAGGFASLRDFFPFCSSEDISMFTTKMTLNEKIYGLGEKFIGIDRRGQHIESIHQDCAGNEGSRTYKNVPFYLSTAGYGVFVNSAYLMDFDIGSGNFDYSNIFLNDSLMDVFLIAGPSLKDILYRYCTITGFAPKLPRWSYGLWMSRNSYENSDIVMEIASKLREEDIPCDVLHLDTYWFDRDWVCDLKFSEDRFPEPEELISDLNEMGYNVSIWQLPYIHESLENYAIGVENDYFVKHSDGSIYKFEWFDDRYALLDFSNNEAVSWYISQIKDVLKKGAVAVKTDIAEGMPVDGIYKNSTGEEFHNLFPLIYNKVMYEAAEEVHGTGIVWARSSYAGGQRYPLPWSGDSRSTYENMAGALRSGLSIGLSGHPFWSHDIGGFIGRPDAELYVRWAQFGLFSSHSRCHGGGNTNSREPWAFGEEALSVFRKFAKLRYRLMPYIFSTEAGSCSTGLPFLRHLALMHQDDRNVHTIYDQYYFGDSMMIAPILNPGGSRQVYIPEGTWYDYWTNKKTEGPVWLEVECPLDSIPIYIPAGAIIPYGPEQSYVDEMENSLEAIHVYSGASNEFIYENGETKALLRVDYINERTVFHDGGLGLDYELKVIGE